MSKLKRLAMLLFLGLLVFMNTPVVFAATNNFTEAEIRSRRLYYLGGGNVAPPAPITADNCSASPAAPTVAGKVYMLGDSITQGSEGQLKSALTAKGFSQVVLDGIASRKLSSGGSQLDGQTILENSTVAVKDATTIIIALGTNNGVTAESIKKAINVVKPDPKIASPKVFWVNFGVNNKVRSNPPGPLDFTASNAALDGNSTLGYTVINWNIVVTAHPEYIDPDPVTGLGVHPASGAGKQAFADTVANAVAGAPASTCGAGALTGDAAQKAAYLFFVRKGLAPFQSAAIVGNMIGESGVNPRRVEGTYFNDKHPCHRKTLGYPKEMDTPPTDNVFGSATTCAGYAGKPTENVQPGYGIVQWSGGRRQNLITFAAADPLNKKSPSDLNLQFEFVWQELTTSYNARVYLPLQASTTIEAAVDIWVRKFEVPGNPDGAIKSRIPLANGVLVNYGSTSAAASSN